MKLVVFIIILALVGYFTIPVKKEEYVKEYVGEDDSGDRNEDAGIILMDEYF